MIVARISMGLGNQMFQYAAALALSKKHCVPLKVETSCYSGYKLRVYELEKYFKISAPEVTTEELLSFQFNHPVKQCWNKLFPNKKLRVLGLPYEEEFLPRMLLRSFSYLYPEHKRSTYQEPHYHFDPNFFKAQKKVYLQGYWMSWKYFYKFEAEVKKAFTIRNEFINHLADLAATIRSENSVGVHIRRTDITDPRIVALKGNLDVDYYSRALSYVMSRTGFCKAYFFSDDVEWVKSHFSEGPGHRIFVDQTITTSAIEDFYLMTQCRHNIIANSTFSWWAAYLNNHKDKIVIAPKNWYRRTGIDTKDVCPPSWTLFE